MVAAFFLLCGGDFSPCSLYAGEQAALFTHEAENLAGISTGKIDPSLAAIGYSGRERLAYDVFWTGGVKIGELQLAISVLPEADDSYAIDMQVSTRGSLMQHIYPIKDRHLTVVSGEDKLPNNARIWQKEGYRYRAFREAIFDQKSLLVTTKRNGEIKGVFPIDGTTNNELSAFFNSRLMPFSIGKPFIVPTFADNKRIPVKVTPVKKEQLVTIFGNIETFLVVPQLTFRGLYDKEGDTVIWYSADKCRVPVQIRSKIVIGSLTAKLTHYTNDACSRYNMVVERASSTGSTETKYD